MQRVAAAGDCCSNEQQQKFEIRNLLWFAMDLSRVAWIVGITNSNCCSSLLVSVSVAMALLVLLSNISSSVHPPVRLLVCYCCYRWDLSWISPRTATLCRRNQKRFMYDLFTSLNKMLRFLWPQKKTVETWLCYLAKKRLWRRWNAQLLDGTIKNLKFLE